MEVEEVMQKPAGAELMRRPGAAVPSTSPDEAELDNDSTYKEKLQMALALTNGDQELAEFSLTLQPRQRAAFKNAYKFNTLPAEIEQ